MSVERRVRVQEERVGKAPEPDQPGHAQMATADRVLALQRTHGNQAVVQMLARNGDDAAPAAKAPGDVFKDAVKAGDWAAAAAALDAMTDAEIQPLITTLTESERDKLDAAAVTLAAMPKKTDRVHRHLSFKKNAPGAEAAHPAEVTVKKPGKEEHTGKAGGGDVSVHTGTEMEVGGKKYDEAFSIGYKGKDAEKTRWLQFIWREILVEDTKKGKFAVDQAITTTGGSYRLTTDASKPSYNTDTASATSPFYEAGGVDNRSADATTIFDQPASAAAIVKAQFTADVTKVTSRAHFTTYMIRDMSVLYKVTVDVEWVYTSATDPPRTQNVKADAAATALDPEMRKRLITQFPKFDYLP